MRTRDRIRQRLVFSVLLFILLSIIVGIYSKYSDKETKINTIKKTFTKTFTKKYEIADHELNELVVKAERIKDGDKSVLFAEDQFVDAKKNNIALFLFEYDLLTFWTDQSIPIPNYYQYNYYFNSVLNPGNGYYHPVVRKMGSRKYVALIKIKDEYPVSNHYLENLFLPEFGVPKDAHIVPEGMGDLDLLDGDEDVLFSIKISDNLGKRAEILLSVLVGSIIAVFFLVLYYAVHFIRNRKIGFLFVLISSGTTAFLIFSPTSYSFFNASALPLFSPEIYAGKIFSSLGLLVVFSMWLLYTAYALNHILPRIFIPLKSNKNYIFLITVPVISAGFVFFVFRLIQDLVFNSLAYPNLDKLPELTFYSLVMALSLVIIFHSLRVLLDGIGKTCHVDSLDRPKNFLLLIIPIAILITMFTQSDMLFLIPATILAYVSLSARPSSSLFHLLLVSLAGGLLFTFACAKPMDLKKDTEATLIASKMSAENDPLTEYLFENIKERIGKDENFLNGIFSSSSLTSDFTDLLIKKYFNGYWLKYGITAGVFDSRTRSRLNIKNSGVNDFEYYNEIIENIGVETPVEGLYFVRKPSGRISYIARLDFTDSLRYHEPKRTVFFEFNSRIISETAGLPDILLDNSFLSNQLLEGYSYARYTKNRLVNENGSFPYFTDLSSWLALTKGATKVESEGYVHYINQNDNNDTIIISRKSQTGTDYFNRFSWWFLAILITIGFERIFIVRREENLSWRRAGFKKKIQIITIVTISGFFIVMVRGSVFYLVKQNETQNTRAVMEKLHAVAINLEETMGGKLSRITEQKGYLEYRLSELGNLFGTDINIYDTRGFLLSGSRPELFTSGFISERLHPESVDFLKNKNLTEFIKNEHIGGLNYISAYAPLIDEDGRTVAFLNIPYFLKQKEINEELSESVNSLVNIFIGSITLLLTIVLLLTNRITDPLRILGKRLSELRYGNKTAKITYEGNDEIGDLVKEYNRLAEELEQSASLLAEKERESAWREMARQVAHEIKNPLTPMKLNVEFIEKAWKDKNPDFEVRLARFKNIMIEQIDTLSHIADEFSNFAKLPPPQNEATDLSEILKGVAGLYANNEHNVTVSFEDSRLEMPIWADKEHLLRVFNNLVKNAIQAIPEGQSGLVEIFAFTDNHSVTALVKDNGSGIPLALRERIFIPNFTTKSAGSGLGLAICRNIIREAGGTIDFITETGVGTTFRVTLPLFHG
jgi:two-component system nitrogen regulation sensor histidine kinase NtrY